MDSGPLIPLNGAIARENQPVIPSEVQQRIAPNVYAYAPDSQESVLHEYFRILIKRKWMILSTLGIIVGPVAIATLRATRIYQATGSIAINKTDPLMFAFSSPNGSGAPSYYDQTDVDTEVRVLSSDLLALQVIQQLDLQKLPEFGGDSGSPPQTLGLTTDQLQPDSAESRQRWQASATSSMFP